MVTKAKPKAKKTKRPFSARLDDERWVMIDDLEKKTGASRSSIANIAITELWERKCGGKKAD